MKKSIFAIVTVIHVACIIPKAQELELNPVITYLTPTSAEGAISLSVSGGTEPYAYQWTLNNQPLPDTDGSLSGLEKGAYRVTVTDSDAVSSTAKYNLYYEGLWDSFLGLDETGGIYSKSDSGPDYGSAISDNIYEAGNWKFFEFDIYDIEAAALFGYTLADRMPSVPGDIIYGFRLIDDGNRTLQIIENGKVESSGLEYVAGDRLKIMFNTTLGNVRYYKNGIFLKKTDYTQLVPMNVGLLVGDGAGVSLSWNTNLGYGAPERGNSYAKLGKTMDASFYQLAHETFLNNFGNVVAQPEIYLKFTYEERYNIVEGKNDRMLYKIYDWKRELLADSDMPNAYGVNWHEVDVSGLGLEAGEFYTLEVTGVNKDEKYYLRFRR